MSVFVITLKMICGCLDWKLNRDLWAAL